MKNFLKIIGIVLLVAGSSVAVFSTIPMADYLGIAADAFGFALLVGATLKKAEKKTWKEYLGVILFAVAGLCCGFAGLAESTMSQIVSLVSGLIALILGLISVKKAN